MEVKNQAMHDTIFIYKINKVILVVEYFLYSLRLLILSENTYTKIGKNLKKL